MKYLPVIPMLLAMLVTQSSAAEPKQAAAARAIFEPWQQAHTQPAERFLHIVCWTPSDREFPAGHHDRLSRMLSCIQDFYGQQMDRCGFGKRTFALNRDEQKRVVMIDVRGKHPTSHYTKDSGNEIRKECLPALQEVGIDADRETIAIFCNLATWDAKALRFSHESPYYAGGTYRHGTAWQLDSPELDTWNLPKTEPMIQDGEYGRISLGKHNSIFIGGMAHELGHALGLPHCKERPDQRKLGTSLMGGGNRTFGDEIRGEGRGTFLTFAHALRLATHPLFCGRLETQENKPQASLSDVQIQADTKAISISGRVTGEPPVYGVVAYFDPEGNSNYNQTSATAIPDGEGRFDIRSDALEPGKRGILHLVPLHANGAISNYNALRQMQYPYQVADDGTPDIQTAQARLTLEPIVKALGRKDLDEAQHLAAKITNQVTARVAAALVNTQSPVLIPAAFQHDSGTVSLAEFKPDAVTVGWSRPTYNRIPDASMLLQSAGEIFATGIFAHAPARHEYTLGGRWKTLAGKVGLADGHDGTVRFQIKGDGHELWQSPVVQAHQLIPFKVEVLGIEHLELIVSPADDGHDNDWALWLDLMLSR